MTESTTEVRLPPATRRNVFNDRKKEALTGWLMASPVIFLLLLFLIVPFIFAFYFSFTNQRLISPNPTEFVGLRNFKSLLTLRTFTLEPVTDPSTGQAQRDESGQLVYPSMRGYTRKNPDYPQLNGLREWTSWRTGNNRTYLLTSDVVFMRALVNTLLFVIIVAPLQAGLALVLALLINQPLRGINVFRTIYFMPVVISMVVIAVLWRFIYDGSNGLLNSMLGLITFGSFKPVDWLATTTTAMPALIAMSIWQAVGFHMVIWLSGLQTIPSVLYEAASTEGANTQQKFRFVTWPGLRNTAVLILIVITIQAFGLFVQVNVMTRGGPLDATQSIVFQAYERGFEKQDIAGGSAISVLLFIIVLSISLIQRYLTRERNV
jgi:multiple sugar transport system permease protein